MRQICLALMLVLTGQVMAQEASIIGSWQCQTVLGDNDNTLVITRQEYFNASGDYQSTTESVRHPNGKPDQLDMHVSVVLRGQWQLNHNELTTEIEAISLADQLNPNSPQALTLLEQLGRIDRRQANVIVTPAQLILTHDGHSLTCQRAS